jgi:hypothetical protein
MHGPSAGRHDNGVKTNALRHPTSLLREENFGGPGNAFLLPRQQRFSPIAKRFSSLDFDKTQNSSRRMGNKIDFSGVGAYAAANNSIAL